jgi:hypothetical protein
MTKPYLCLVSYDVYKGPHNTDLQTQKYSSLAFASVVFILLLSLLLRHEDGIALKGICLYHQNDFGSLSEER